MDPNQVSQTPPNPGSLPVQPLPIESPQLPPEVPKQRKMPTLLAVILIVMLLGGLSAGTYVLNMNKSAEPAPKKVTKTIKPSPTQIPTPTIANAIPSDWLIYTNNSLGIQFNYPATLKLTQSDEKYYTQDAKKLDLKNYAADEEYMHPDAVSVTLHIISPTKPITDLTTWLEDISVGERIDGKVGATIGKVVPFKNAGIDGLTYTDGQEVVRKNIAFQKNNTVFIFSLNPTSGTGGSYDENKTAVKQFDQILASFQFIDQLKTTNACEGLSENACVANPMCIRLSGPTCPTCTDMKFIACKEKTQ